MTPRVNSLENCLSENITNGVPASVSKQIEEILHLFRLWYSPNAHDRTLFSSVMRCAREQRILGGEYPQCRSERSWLTVGGCTPAALPLENFSRSGFFIQKFNFPQNGLVEVEHSDGDIIHLKTLMEMTRLNRRQQ